MADVQNPHPFCLSSLLAKSETKVDTQCHVPQSRTGWAIKANHWVITRNPWICVKCDSWMIKLSREIEGKDISFYHGNLPWIKRSAFQKLSGYFQERNLHRNLSIHLTINQGKCRQLFLSENFSIKRREIDCSKIRYYLE